MTCCASHAEADLDHKPVPNWDDTGDCDHCTACGLAVTGLGERHGFDGEPDGHEEYDASRLAHASDSSPEPVVDADGPSW
jgi:hypothetical protein